MKPANFSDDFQCMIDSLGLLIHICLMSLIFIMFIQQNEPVRGAKYF